MFSFSRVSFIVLLLCLLDFILVPVHAKTLNAAVGMGLKNGLHAKYLKYFADELGYQLVIHEMPFARRIKQASLGNLDLLVGLHQESKPLQRDIYQSNYFENLHYVTPAYESLSYTLFAHAHYAHEIDSMTKLHHRLVGVSQHASHFPELDDNNLIVKIPTRDVTQKIEMLLHNRIDAFVNLEQTTFRHLKNANLLNQVKKTHYQTQYHHFYYVVLSKSSRYYPTLATQLSASIQSGIDKGVFKKIREEHYK